MEQSFYFSFCLSLDGEKICHLLHVIGGFLVVFLRLSVGVIVLKMAALGPVIG
jgi:hypothetical protein